MTLSRRGFLVGGLGAAGGLALGLYLTRESDPEPTQAGGFRPDAILALEPDGRVEVWIPRSEMGQGVLTGLAMLVCEELRLPLARVAVLKAPTHPRFGRMSTGGSWSVRQSWTPFRVAGAAAREMLVAAAADQWGVPASACEARDGTITHPASGRSFAYAEVVGAAGRREVPRRPRLAGPGDRTLVGTSAPRVDGPEKADGRAVFGLDVTRPGLRHAVLARPPVVGARLEDADAEAARRIPGVRRVVELPEGLAVVADTTWAALKGREALAARWQVPEAQAWDDAALDRALAAGLAAAKVARDDGEVDQAMAQAARTLEATYRLPYLAHATLEPQNATAWLDPDGILQIHAPTQAPTWAQRDAAAAAGLPEEKVRVQPTFLGGGFGRRSMPDFVVEAARLAVAEQAPVKVTWSREDDLRHDYYRPPSLHRLQAALDGEGRLMALTHTMASPSITQHFWPERLALGALDEGALEGAVDMPYRVPAFRAAHGMIDTPVHVGWWRGVYHTQTAFANEVFLDEVAKATGADPVALRLSLLSEAPRDARVLRQVAEAAGWGRRPAEGRALGVACHPSFGSHVAMVAEVSLEDRRPRVHQVWCVVDPGTVVNPDLVAAQMESGIAFGLSAALRGEITLDGGRVVEDGFGAYEPVRFSEMPRVHVEWVDEGREPGGIGEVGCPPIAPAVANAVASLTGRPVRRLPLSRALAE